MGETSLAEYDALQLVSHKLVRIALARGMDDGTVLRHLLLRTMKSFFAGDVAALSGRATEK
ncbi:MAG TPA: hypothetical protein VGN91_07945 [Bosea sp. (in: a-proteobacteria)]|jgi:hypothetical protein|nr:hypothetical protein [Bosea sp. (in: a-proteobacteria)]